nr:cytochrome-c peroxidase [Flavobacteriales bacterium]
MDRWCLPFVLLGVVLVLQACRKDPGMEQPTDTPIGPTPLTLSVPSWAVDTVHALNLPYDNPLTVEGVALGRRLFYEKALSNDFSMSCATCHRQENAFSDPRQFSIGTDGSAGRRQGMAIINAAWDHFFF